MSDEGVSAAADRLQAAAVEGLELLAAHGVPAWQADGIVRGWLTQLLARRYDERQAARPPRDGIARAVERGLAAHERGEPPGGLLDV